MILESEKTLKDFFYKDFDYRASWTVFSEPEMIGAELANPQKN
jgi:hypothetical protein